MTRPQLQDPTLLIGKNYVDGEWLDSVCGRVFEVYDPANNEVIGTCPESTVEDAELAIQAAARAWQPWKSQPGRQRSRLLRRFYELVLENTEDLATIISWENGKSTADARSEVLFAASFLEWYAEEAARIYGAVIPHTAVGYGVSTVKESVGVCAMITPWNYPAGMITRKVGPALAAGCTVIVKSDGNTPFTANALAVLSARAGLPKGVLNFLTASENTPSLGLHLCQSVTVRKISFTGSTRVGKILATQSGNTLKKLSLELGGNAPFIVFNDADVDIAVSGLIASKFKVSGQTCVSANRIYVQEEIHDEFVKRLTSQVSTFTVGPSLGGRNTIGPLIGANGVAKVRQHIADAVQKGGKIAFGGEHLTHLGLNFLEPTIITDATDSMLISKEETFGPVAAIFTFKSETEVIRRANDSEVGLASYIFSTDHNRIMRVSKSLETGMVAINTGVISDAPSPFGGVKDSGIGREGGVQGIEEYLQLKTIVTGNLHSRQSQL